MAENSNYIEGNNNNIVNGNDNTINQNTTIHNHYYIKENKQESRDEIPDSSSNKNDDKPPFNPTKKKIKLDPINEKFRNFKMDYFVGFSTIFITALAAGYGRLELYSLIIPIIVAFIYLVYLPRKYPFMFIYVHEDKLIYNINKTVNYSEIKEFKYRNNGFDFRLNKPKYTSFTLYSVEKSSFIFDSIKRYAIAADTLMPHN